MSMWAFRQWGLFRDHLVNCEGLIKAPSRVTPVTTGEKYSNQTQDIKEVEGAEARYVLPGQGWFLTISTGTQTICGTDRI